MLDIKPDGSLVTTNFHSDFLGDVKGFGQGGETLVQWQWDSTPLEGGTTLRPDTGTQLQRQTKVDTRKTGGGPHVLALAARHPARVSAITVVVGASPLAPDEVAHLVGVNAQGYALAEQGWQELHDFLAQVRVRLLSDEGMPGVLSDAPATDRALMEDPAWQRMSRGNLAEALKQGAEGWTDESMAMHRDWDFDPGQVRTRVTWWHGDDDMNAPLSAARRVAERIPKVDLRVWHGEGHFVSVTHDREIVQELLDRST